MVQGVNHSLHGVAQHHSMSHHKFLLMPHFPNPLRCSQHLMPKLDATHFQAIAVHLQATLTELGADPQDIQEAMAVVASTKTEVLDQ